MTLWLCFVLFVAPVLAGNIPIDSQTLETVFGTQNNYAVQPLALAQGQAAAVRPNNNTLVDLDYWDSTDEFTPSNANYDRFDWALTKRVASASTENFLLSPLGLKLALAILTEAATGITKSELSSVLSFEEDRTAVRRKFSSILESLQSQTTQNILTLGSRIYVENSAEPRQRFAAIAQEFYKTDLKRINFGDAVAASKEINAWVSNLTQGRIPNVVTEEDLDGVVVMILNALFFKGTWSHQFAPNATQIKPFYKSPTFQSHVPFMNLKSKFYYAESAKFDAKILRMPYLGNKFSMYLIVPNSLTGLDRVFSAISELRAEMLYLQERIVDVTMPKFRFVFKSQLNGILKELGIRQAFEDSASFPGIARGQMLHDRLRVSKVQQRSGIEVNELGSEAYVATSISLVNKFGEDDDTVQEVVANKPFLFFIEDEATRQLLFTGRMTNPLDTKAEFQL